jgi:ATP-dependent RNA helicase HelY
LDETVRLWSDLAADESDRGMSRTREPDAGFAWSAYRWARGERLEQALDASSVEEQLSAGDFVRWCKQLIDLLDQIGGVAQGRVGARAREAVAAIRRGVVAANSTG